MDDLLSEFLVETHDSLSALDNNLVSLESRPNDASAVAEIFRVVHTIKGTCGFLGLRRLERVAHASEELLRCFQDSIESVSSARVSLVLEALDCLKTIVEGLSKTGTEPTGDDSDLLARLEREADSAGAERQNGKEAQQQQDDTAGEQTESPTPSAAETEFPTPSAAETESPTPSAAETESRSVATLESEEEGDEEILLPFEQEGGAGLDIASPWQGAVAGQTFTPAGALSTLRVRLDLIEQLMNSVSELVLSRNQLLQMLRQNPSSEFSAPLQRLNQITTALQEKVMKTRMQPIQNAWNSLPRLVRDLSKSTGKQVRLETVGAETELDRQIIDQIRDPLVHLIRNAVDHGLESPEVRVLHGKPKEGVIALRAYQEGGQILIEVQDDGRGIDHETIRNKIVARGQLSEADAASLSVSQLYRYLFQAGFSTAEKITEVSGRGVGMDVVKNNIDKIGGQIELNSTLRAGTHIRIKIPLTLAIVSVLIAKVGEERYAFPQTSVIELVSFSETADHRVSVLQGKLVLQLREKLLPLLSIRQLFELTASLPAPSENNERNHEPAQLHDRDRVHASVALLANGANGANGEKETSSLSDIISEAVSPAPVASASSAPASQMLSQGEIEQRLLQEILQGNDNYVIVMRVGAQQFGVLVEDIQDTEEIVVKPLSESLRDTPFFNGNTILGDGRVVLIVEPNALFDEIGEGVEEAALALPQDEQQQIAESNVTLVMLDSGSGVKKVVPVSAINRLEHIDCSRIEYPNAKPIVLYNDSLMPVMRIEEGRALPKEGRRPVLVLSDGEKWAGIVVEEVLDILNEPLHIEAAEGEKGVIGSAILQEQSVEVLDMDYFWKRAFVDAENLPLDLSGVEGIERSARKARRLLLIEKNRAFCDAIIPHLSSLGFRVFVVDHIEHAISYHRNAVPFDVIVSDIDDNSEEVLKFISRTRQTRDSWSGLPFLALTSLPSNAEKTETCRLAGFTDFLSKNDRSNIMRCLKSL